MAFKDRRKAAAHKAALTVLHVVPPKIDESYDWLDAVKRLHDAAHASRGVYQGGQGDEEATRPEVLR